MRFNILGFWFAIPNHFELISFLTYTNMIENFYWGILLFSLLYLLMDIVLEQKISQKNIQQYKWKKVHFFQLFVSELLLK